MPRRNGRDAVTIDEFATERFHLEAGPLGPLPLPSTAVHSRIRQARLVAAAGRVVVVWLPGFVIMSSGRPGSASTFAWSIFVAAVWLATFRTAFSRGHHSLGVGVAVFVGTVTGILAISAAAVWLPGLGLSAAEVTGMAVGVFAGTSIWEWLIVRTDAGKRRVLLVGDEGTGSSVADELGQVNLGPFVLVGAVDDTPVVAGATPLLGGLTGLRTVLEAERPDLVVLTSPSVRSKAIDALIDAAGSGFRVVDLSSFFEHALGRVPVDRLTPTWFMSVLHLRQPTYATWSKRLFDVVVALFALVLVAPVMALIALLVAGTPGPIIFRQTRLGESGAPFTLLKFRTMVERAEQGQASWAMENDCRVTRIGRYLRKSHLDELPQLLNVLRGDMSIVGPRPERPEFVSELKSEVPFWNRRLLIKPGLTGWAQIRCGYTADSERAAEKLSYDLWYLRNRSLLTDLTVCAKTLPAMFGDVRAR